MNIYLIGYRGSGKTTVAQRLAARLWWHWIDADQLLEAQAGKSIKDIFASEGEDGFRELEAGVVARLAWQNLQVVALGGGAVLREDNRAAIASSGKVVWLQAPPEVLWSRIQADATTQSRRPDLTAGGGLDEVKRLLAERTPLYDRCADLRLDTDGKSQDELVAAIIEWMQGEGLTPAN